MIHSSRGACRLVMYAIQHGFSSHMKMYAIPVVVLLVISYSVPATASLHASCNADWTTGRKCTSVIDSLVTQINKWTGKSNCPNAKNEKCLYSLGVHSQTMITAKHRTPVKGYVDLLKFDFVQDKAICKIHGYSSSEVWYAVYDHGTNYCNLFNLIQGIGLDKTENYTETTNDGICTEHSTADCSKY